MIARLLDSEGVTWKELAIEERMPAIRMLRLRQPTAILAAAIIDAPFTADFHEIEFVYERMTGDGVLIYRLREP